MPDSPHLPPDDAARQARRTLIKAALAAAPTVLTVTAGTAQAAQGSGYASGPKTRGIDASTLDALWAETE
jgi:hypothetical protein